MTWATERVLAGLTAAMSAVVLTVAGAGCSGGASGSGPSGLAATPTGVPTPASAQQLAFPINSYELSDQEETELEYVANMLEKTCMARLGYDFMPDFPADYVSAGTRAMDYLDTREWGITDLAVARQYGYGLPPWASASAAQIASAKLPQDQMLPFFGVTINGGSPAPAPAGTRIPEGGCRGWALDKISAAGVNPLGTTPSAVAQINASSYTRTLADPRVHAAFRKWAACMATGGYHYSTPYQPGVRYASAPLSRAEIRTAVRDIECKLKVNLLGVTYAVQSQYQDQMISEHATELRQIRASIRSQEQALARLMAETANPSGEGRNPGAASGG